jgi:transposase
MDTAAYNRSSRVRAFAEELGIWLIYLPPYSPNLNPIERPWNFLRRNLFTTNSIQRRQSLKMLAQGVPIRPEVLR